MPLHKFERNAGIYEDAVTRGEDDRDDILQVVT